MKKIEVRFIGDEERIIYDVDDVVEVWKCMSSFHGTTAFKAYNFEGREVFINAKSIQRVWPLDNQEE